ncbi:hypothetical protein BDZ90DRAFT_146466 [Jaminaea rosea]|uniref:Uncharacterized protein n=1 Tax=Jaminaea rosea TaxID=1569628 RepID=A0A316UWR9_9BASI|nr:hypothetical protein BDZ90DRAFT_146466 [Jaminaea rosea]PWN28363.1 hypothetical protein BDZ90DRAFT_146466 [Jaminaea rosea]
MIHERLASSLDPFWSWRSRCTSSTPDALAIRTDSLSSRRLSDFRAWTLSCQTLSHVLVGKSTARARTSKHPIEGRIFPAHRSVHQENCSGFCGPIYHILSLLSGCLDVYVSRSRPCGPVPIGGAMKTQSAALKITGRGSYGCRGDRERVMGPFGPVKRPVYPPCRLGTTTSRSRKQD